MAEAVIMPRQGQSVESCLVTAINKKKGDNVNIGDILFSYETDKSTFDEESKISGTILALFIEEGDDVPCLDTVMIIGSDGENITGLTPQNASKSEPPAAIDKLPEPENIAAVSIEPVIPVSMGITGEMKISPRAKNYAEQSKADLSKVIPTGPNGRIIERDVIELVNKGYRLYNVGDGEPKHPSPAGDTLFAKEGKEKETETSADSYTDVKLPNIRKIIAKSMQASLSEMAQLTLNSSFDATAILKFRKRLKDLLDSKPRNAEGGVPYENITLNDIILYATAKTLKNHKDANARKL